MAAGEATATSVSVKGDGGELVRTTGGGALGVVDRALGPRGRVLGTGGGLLATTGSLLVRAAGAFVTAAFFASGGA